MSDHAAIGIYEAHSEALRHRYDAVSADDLESWRQKLLQNKVSIEREISWPQGGHSIYFRDPAGNSLELATTSTWD